MRCNLACKHCGSRAGQAREAELTTAEALDVVEQLAEVGIDEVTLIGGEAFLRPDWLTNEHLVSVGFQGWQVQLTGPIGNATDDPSILLQPPELLDLFPMLAQLARRAWQEGIVFLPSNNVGYYGPYERLLRSNGHPWGFWQGPSDGRSTIGIDRTVP